MNRTTTERINDHAILVLTILSELIAYCLALIFRYLILNPLFNNPDRVYDFYRMFLVFVLLARLLLYYLRERPGKIPPLYKQTPVEILAIAIQQHSLLLVFLVLFIYFIRWSTRVSRTVMFFLIFWGIVLDFISRRLFVKHYVKRYGKFDHRKKVLLISEKTEEKRLSEHLNHYGYTNRKLEISFDFEVAKSITPEEFKHGELIKDEFDYVFLSDRALKKFSVKEACEVNNIGIPVLQELRWNNHPLSSDIVKDCGGFAVINDSLMSRKGDVLGVHFTAASIPETAEYFLNNREQLKGQYICFSNVHTTTMAADDEAYQDVLNGSAFTMPDGNPIAKKLKEQGFLEAERVAGPDLMDQLFRISAGTDARHYFYGSSEETIKKLKENLEKNYPDLKIVGMYSPPFRPLTEEEDKNIVDLINASKPDFVWIGLGAPKQENWMAAHKGKINGLMLGVGAGFDFHAGTVRRAPVLVQKLGLEWLYRLFQDPKRLLKRYFSTNAKFLWYVNVAHNKK